MRLSPSRLLLLLIALLVGGRLDAATKPRVLVASDGEIDDECSPVRFLLYANEWDVEGIITSSSQYHGQGHKCAGDDWAQPYLRAYAEVHSSLILHDPGYPTPTLRQARTRLGNVKAEGEMEEATASSRRIVEVLPDDSDPRPVRVQAWGGTNPHSRALKTIEETHPEKMAAVAGKLRLYLIWEQDRTFQEYIRPQWDRFGVLTIISDQFIALFDRSGLAGDSRFRRAGRPVPRAGGRNDLGEPASDLPGDGSGRPPLTRY